MPPATIDQRASGTRRRANAHGPGNWLHARSQLEPRVLQGPRDGRAPTHAVLGSQWAFRASGARAMARRAKHLAAMVPDTARRQSG